jgi:hypothetical protein
MSVPADFKYETKDFYDPKYQAKLYAEGVAEGRKGAWLKAPPGQTPISVPPERNRRSPEVTAPPKKPVSSARASKAAQPEPNTSKEVATTDAHQPN